MALFDFWKKKKPAGKQLEPTPIRYGVNMPLHTLINSGSRTSIKSPDEAMTVAAFYASINMISNSVATMPRSWYYRDDQITRKYAEYDQQRLIKQETRPGIIPFRAFRTWVSNYLKGGNGYMIIGRDRNFRPIEYINRTWYEMLPFLDEDDYLWYYDQKGKQVLPYYNVLHLADLHDETHIGKSKVSQFAEMLGGQKAASSFVNAYFSKGLFLGAVIEYPESVDIDTDTANLLEKTMNEMYGSVDKSGQIGVITEGGKLKQLKTDIPLGDAQYIESQKLTREDIAMIFSIPISLLNSSQSSYNTLEQTTTQYIEKAVLPILTQIEQEMNLKCVRPTERNSVYMEHEVNGILRADASTQAMVLEKYIKSGLMTINEARHLRNMTPIEGGDTILIQANNMDTLDHVLNPVDGNNNSETETLDPELLPENTLTNMEAILTAFFNNEIALDYAIELLQISEDMTEKEAFDLIKDITLI